MFDSWGGDALAPDRALVTYDWPDRFAIASALALTAALLTLALRPSVWRKLRHTGALTAFAGFAVVLALNGVLGPWSG